jgi:hypothetical protein
MMAGRSKYMCMPGRLASWACRVGWPPGRASGLRVWALAPAALAGAGRRLGGAAVLPGGCSDGCSEWVLAAVRSVTRPWGEGPVRGPMSEVFAASDGGGGGGGNGLSSVAPWRAQVVFVVVSGRRRRCINRCVRHTAVVVVVVVVARAWKVACAGSRLRGESRLRAFVESCVFGIVPQPRLLSLVCLRFFFFFFFFFVVVSLLPLLCLHPRNETEQRVVGICCLLLSPSRQSQSSATLFPTQGGKPRQMRRRAGAIGERSLGGGGGFFGVCEKTHALSGVFRVDWGRDVVQKFVWSCVCRRDMTIAVMEPARQKKRLIEKEKTRSRRPLLRRAAVARPKWG